MHQVVRNILRTFLHTDSPQNVENTEALVDYALLATASTVHQTLGVSPGASVLHRDIFIDVPYIADLLLLKEKHQALINDNV
jgi:hypothetical protein